MTQAIYGESFRVLMFFLSLGTYTFPLMMTDLFFSRCLFLIFGEEIDYLFYIFFLFLAICYLFYNFSYVTFPFLETDPFLAICAFLEIYPS